MHLSGTGNAKPGVAAPKLMKTAVDTDGDGKLEIVYIDQKYLKPSPNGDTVSIDPSIWQGISDAPPPPIGKENATAPANGTQPATSDTENEEFTIDDARQVIIDNFAAVDIAKNGKNPDKLIGKEDLETVAENKGDKYAPELQAAATMLLKTPKYVDELIAGTRTATSKKDITAFNAETLATQEPGAPAAKPGTTSTDGDAAAPLDGITSGSAIKTLVSNFDKIVDPKSPFINLDTVIANADGKFSDEVVNSAKFIKEDTKLASELDGNTDNLISKQQFTDKLDNLSYGTIIGDPTEDTAELPYRAADGSTQYARAVSKTTVSGPEGQTIYEFPNGKQAYIGKQGNPPMPVLKYLDPTAESQRVEKQSSASARERINSLKDSDIYRIFADNFKQFAMASNTGDNESNLVTKIGLEKIAKGDFSGTSMADLEATTRNDIQATAIRLLDSPALFNRLDNAVLKGRANDGKIDKDQAFAVKNEQYQPSRDSAAEAMANTMSSRDALDIILDKQNWDVIDASYGGNADGVFTVSDFDNIADGSAPSLRKLAGEQQTKLRAAIMHIIKNGVLKNIDNAGNDPDGSDIDDGKLSKGEVEKVRDKYPLTGTTTTSL